MTKSDLIRLLPLRYDYRKRNDPYQEHRKLLDELVAEGKIVLVEKTHQWRVYERAK